MIELFCMFFLNFKIEFCYLSLQELDYGTWLLGLDRNWRTLCGLSFFLLKSLLRRWFFHIVALLLIDMYVLIIYVHVSKTCRLPCFFQVHQLSSVMIGSIWRHREIKSVLLLSCDHQWLFVHFIVLHFRLEMHSFLSIIFIEYIGWCETLPLGMVLPLGVALPLRLLIKVGPPISIASLMAINAPVGRGKTHFHFWSISVSISIS